MKHVPIKATSTGIRRGDVQHSTARSVMPKDGKGNGPAASALKVPPPDLTVLSKNNKGSYPSLKVSAIIRGEQPLPAHGSKDMPVWGSLFWKMSQGHEVKFSNGSRISVSTLKGCNKSSSFWSAYEVD